MIYSDSFWVMEFGRKDFILFFVLEIIQVVLGGLSYYNKYILYIEG